MKKLYRKGTVHPSPPPDLLSFLPAAILSRAAALSPEDREVLAYLLLSSSNKPKRPSTSASASAGKRSSGDHAPEFGCDCFRCYTSFWVRWDSSANRELIHEIIEAYEEHDHRGYGQKGGGRTGRRERRGNRQRGGGKSGAGEDCVVSTAVSESTRSELAESDRSEEKVEAVVVEEREEGLVEKGSSSSSQVRRFVSFIGERFWGVWG